MVFVEIIEWSDGVVTVAIPSDHRNLVEGCWSNLNDSVATLRRGSFPSFEAAKEAVRKMEETGVYGF